MKKMKIKIAGSIGLLLWIMVLAQVIVTKGFEKKISIMEAFSTGEQVKVKSCSSEIIGRANTDIAEADRIIKEIMERNECSDYETGDISGTLGIKGVCKRAVSAENDIIITVTLTKYDKAQNTYIHYKIEGNNENKDKVSKTEDYFNDNDIECAVYGKICGTISALLSEDECREYSKVLLERVGGTLIEEHYDNDYIAYGYGTSLSDAIVSDDKKINIQIMLSKNEIEENTEICIGTPILLE